MEKIHHKVAHVAKKAVHHIKSFFKGFTIIELIVVIAIIAVLASIVLVNVSGYINKGKDSKVKADVSQITKSLLTFKTENGTFQGYTGVTGISAPCDEGTYTLNASTDAFILYHKLCTTNKYWCSDSAGALVQIDTAPSEGTYICSAGAGGQPEQQGGEDNPSYTKVVTGTLSPDITGGYVDDGLKNGVMRYKRVGDVAGHSWYIFSDGMSWAISVDPDVVIFDHFWSAPGGPNGVYSPHGSASGLAIVATP